MNKTKEQIQDRITELGTYVTDANNTAMSYKSEISMLERELEDINKPVIDDNILDAIYYIIKDHMGSLEDIDPDDCEFDFGIDYEGRITVDSMRVEKSYDYFSESLYNDLKTLFKVNKKEDEGSV